MKIKKQGLKAKIEKTRQLLKSFRQISKNYPKAESYRNTVSRLEREEADLVGQIGKNLK